MRIPPLRKNFRFGLKHSKCLKSIVSSVDGIFFGYGASAADGKFHGQNTCFGVVFDQLWTRRKLKRLGRDR